MRTSLLSRLSLAGVLLALACDAPTDGAALEQQRLELDDIGTPPADMELFMLASDGALPQLREAIQRLDGTLVHVLPPRLVVGRVPAGADAVLRDLGVVKRFARAVTPDELPGLDTREARFVRLFSSRYYPEQLPRSERIAPQRLVRAPDALLERAPLEAQALSFAPGDDDQTAEQNERSVAVPFASGRVVVSIVLPESNGRGEANSEDWSEASVVETYAKVQAALEGIARHEPNAGLDFVLHYESAPAPGGLEGTVDCDWEYGHVAAGAEFSNRAYAQIWSHILGRELGEFESWQAQVEYLAGLKARYGADGAFIVYVAANQNYTAGFRAYASINGPSTSLDTSYGFETFMHEFGHIFGALDEYCPDACVSPSALQGYLGMVNANATFRAGPYGGIRSGRGEAQPSLMTFNVPNGLNGYTRGAFGWVDSDGDGVVEVRDTFPHSRLGAETRADGVHLVGRIVDVPATANYATPFSANRIRALHVRAPGGAWVRLPIASERRGREDVDIALGAPRQGDYALEVRAENSVGNLEPTPRALAFRVEAGDNAAPLVALAADSPVLSTRATVTLRAQVLDLENDAVTVRFDLDGDGAFETPYGAGRTARFVPARAGRTVVAVQARDARGATSRASFALDVLEGDAPARVSLAPLPTPVAGSDRVRIAADARVTDVDRDVVRAWYELERDDAARSAAEKTEAGAPAPHAFDVATPPSLVSHPLDLSSLDASIDRYLTVYDAERLDGSVLALALGELGLAFVDMADPSAPRLLSRLALETQAFDLARVAGRLYVLGDKLTVVDASDASAPREVLQRRTTRNRRAVSSQEPWSFGEEPTKPMPLWVPYFERIEHVRVEVALQHPAWEELRVSLITPKGESIVIWDHARRGRRQRSIVVDDVTLAALVPLVGQRAAGDYRIEVIDDVLNGSKGQVTSATVGLETSHRGFPLNVESPTQIVGALPRGRLLVAGTGLETVELARDEALRSGATLESAPILRAQLAGERVFALCQPVSPVDKDGEPVALPFVRGLFAVDASRALRPLRIDREVTGAGFALAGSRFYVVGDKEEARTRIASQAAFAAGRRYWLGETDVMLGLDLAGDDQSLWSVRGAFERLDVRDPAAVRVVERFDDPPAYGARFLDGRTAFVVGPAGELAQVALDGRTSLVSEVYRVTAHAEAAGASSRASRTVHVIPYDHAPMVSDARFVRGSTTRDPFDLEVRIADPDGRPSWDGYGAVRIDWEGDGIFDGPWQGVYDVATFSHAYTAAGDYAVRVQARDGFYALSDVTIVPLHVEAYVPIACSDSSACPAGEYCELGEACGSAGTCERARSDCYGVDPACGCDGRTYRTACEAQAAGIAVAHAGLCDGEVVRCGGPEAATCTVPGMFCRYEPGETAAQSCGNDQAYGDCVFPPPQCFTAFDAGRIGLPRPSRTVCGCDGQTYSSSCAADVQGVSIQFYGACESGPDCLQVGCDDGQVCTQCFGGYACIPEGAHC